VPPKQLLGAPQHNVTFLSGAFGKHECLVCMFTNALHKNISDKGGALCTLMPRCVICTLMHRPTSYMIFFGALLNGCVGVFMFTNAPPRNVTRYMVCPVNLQVTPYVVRAESLECTAHFFFFFFTLKISLNFKF
jgi:hypothetical protein